MISRKVIFPPTSSSDFPEGYIYALTLPPEMTDMTVSQQIEAFLDAGIRIIQIREKGEISAMWLADAKKAIREIRRRKGVVIMNDHVDLAAELECDGIHVGQSDTAPGAIKRSPEWIIGLSCSSRSEIDAALSDVDVDYIAVGPVFYTPLKQESLPVGLSLLHYGAGRGKPLVAIGGINRSNMQTVLDAGADYVAMIRGTLRL